MVIKRRCNSCKQMAEFPCSCCGHELHHLDCSDRSCEKYWDSVEQIRLNEVERLSKPPRSGREELEEELENLKEYKETKMDKDTTTLNEIKEWITKYITFIEQGFEKALTKWEEIKTGIEKETDLVRLTDENYWDKQIQTLEDNWLPADKQSIVLRNRRESCYGQLEEEQQGKVSHSLAKSKTGAETEIAKIEEKLKNELVLVERCKPEQFYSRFINRPPNTSCPHWRKHIQQVIEYQTAIQQVDKSLIPLPKKGS